MSEEERNKEKEEKKYKTKIKDQGCSAVYGIGLIGALVYFIVTASGFWMGVLGIIKAILWPAFLVYGLFDYLKI
jgi:hypothetical protein